MNFKYIRIVAFIVAILLLSFSKSRAFDLSELKVETGYTAGNGNIAAINQVRGIGTTVGFAWNILPKIRFGLSGGYFYYNVKEDSALYTWNWDYYQRLYSGSLSEFRANPNYDVSTLTKQYLKLKPVQISVQWTPVSFHGITPRLQLAGGVAHYERKLWLNEDWKKHFEITNAQDSTYNYTYEYSFHNYANAKKGWVGIVTGQLAFDVGLSKNFGLSIFGNFSTYSKFRQDSEDFPLVNTYQLGAAIRFLY